MKKFVAILLSISVLLVFAPSSLMVNAYEVNENSTAAILKVYEDLPQTEGLGKLSHDEQVELCQIPEDILKTIDTESLVDIVLDYPLFMDIYAFDTIELGIYFLCVNYNGLGELATRDDAPAILLDKYLQTEPIISTKAIEKSDDIFELANIEALLAQDFIREKLDKQELDMLDYAVGAKYVIKKEHSDIYAFTSAMFYDAYTETVENSKIETASTGYTVYTPKGTPVSVEKKGETLTPTEKTVMNEYVATYYSSSIKIAEPTTNYNCHSYAWYLESTSNLFWMDYPYAYMSDGSYYSTSTAAVNNKIAFYNAGTLIHSGIVKNTTYLAPTGLGVHSKWGAYGLYNHAPAYSPYWSSNNTTLTQYTKSY